MKYLLRVRYLCFIVAALGASALQGESKVSYKKPPLEDIKKKLTPLQCQVTQDGATERPFQNEYWDNQRPGIYVDVVSGEPLFSSTDKFDSGSGWPSFTKPLVATNVKQKKDRSAGMDRIEVKSTHADSHLGHVFDDGPLPTKQRYCINSASLRFIPMDSLEKEGYGEFRSLFMSVASSSSAALSPPGAVDTKKFPPDDFASNIPAGKSVATLAGGCFWGVEEIIRALKGVEATQVGYSGGLTEHPTYKEVSSGKTGHAESVQILYDSTKISFEELLGWFFRFHDPTTMNQQGNDKGTQYRSTIFVYNTDQRKAAELIKEKVDKSGKWKKPVVTEIVDAKPFWKAEEYHQKYLQKNPNGYTCHYIRD